MSRIKIGAEIKNQSDLKELILQLINHCDEFDFALILKLTSNYMENSEISISESNLFILIDEIFYYLEKYGYIENKLYNYKRNPEKTISLHEYSELKRNESLVL